MSSWLAVPTARMPALLLGAALGCEERPASKIDRAPTVESTRTAPPVPLPWFQGTWRGGPTTGDGASSLPLEITLVIDSSGQVLGRSSLELLFRGAVDGDTVRIEAEGAGGHGVLVLHREQNLLRGTLRYAEPKASLGKQTALSLSRVDAP